MNSYFLAVVLDSSQLKVMESVLKKYNPIHKFVPLHTALSKTFELESSEEEHFKEQVKLLLKNIEAFTLSFKGLTQIGKNVHLNLIEGQNHLKKLKSNFASMSSLKKSQSETSRELLDHPLVAKNKSIERVKDALPFKTSPTFKIKIETVTLFKIGSIDENPESFNFQLVKRDPSK